MQGPGQVTRILVAILAEDDALDVRLAGAVGDGSLVRWQFPMSIRFWKHMA